MKNILIVSVSFLLAFADQFYYEFGQKVTLSKLYEKRDINGKNIQYYETNSGKLVGVSDEIIVKYLGSDNSSFSFIIAVIIAISIINKI